MSLFLLDTNIASEPTRPMPEFRVEYWLSRQPFSSLYLSAVTAGELRKGISLLSPGKRRSSLENWLETDILEPFSERVLPVTSAVADRWGRLTAARQSAGRPLDLADGLIAATALEHSLVLVTRNTRHFVDLSLPLLSPWDLQPRIM